MREIAWRSWAAAYGGFIPESDRMTFFERYYAAPAVDDPEAPHLLRLVAESDGRPVGMLTARHQPRGVHLDRLYVDPDSWGRGAGQHLWQALVDWARERGAARILFEVAADGESGPRFYRKQGCRRIGEVVEPVGRTPVRVARYVYDLAGDDRTTS
jgi:ribosomal protein S18 acetylase RimI-like enzyme